VAGRRGGPVSGQVSGAVPLLQKHSIPASEDHVADGHELVSVVQDSFLPRCLLLQGVDVHDDDLGALRSVVAEVIGDLEPGLHAGADREVGLALRVAGDRLDHPFR